MASHKDVTHDLYGSKPEARKQGRKVTICYIQYDVMLPE